MNNKELVVYNAKTPLIHNALTTVGLSSWVALPILSIADANSVTLIAAAVASVGLPVITAIKRIGFRNKLIRNMVYDNLSDYGQGQWNKHPNMQVPYMKEFFIDYERVHVPWYKKLVFGEVVLQRKIDPTDAQVFNVNVNRALITTKPQEVSELSIWKDAISNAYTLDPTFNLEEVKKDVLREKAKAKQAEDLDRYNLEKENYRTQIAQERAYNQMIAEVKKWRSLEFEIEAQQEANAKQAERDFYVAQQLKAKNDLADRRIQEADRIAEMNQVLEARLAQAEQEKEAAYLLIFNQQKQAEAKLRQEAALKEEERKTAALYKNHKQKANPPYPFFKDHYEELSNRIYDYEYNEWVELEPDNPF